MKDDCGAPKIWRTKVLRERANGLELEVARLRALAIEIESE